MKIKDDIVLWGNFYGFFIMGMIILSFGTVMPYMREAYGLSYEQSGLVLSLLAMGNLVFSFISGIISDVVGMIRILISGYILFAVGLLMIVFSPSLWVLYVGTFITGIGWGNCNTSINLVINDKTNGSGKIMNLLHMSFSVGAFLFPIICGFLFAQGVAWNMPLVVLAGAILVAAAFAFKMHIPMNTHHQAKTGGAKKINPLLWIFFGIAFFYGGSESAINGWVVTYVIQIGMSDFFARNILSVFWFCIMVGRYVSSILSKHGHHEWMILSSAIGAIGIFFVFMNATSPLWIIMAIAGLGLMFSSVYPTTMANANPVIKGSGFMGAILTSAGGLGASVIPYISGMAAERAGTTGMVTTIFISLILMAAVAFVNIWSKKSRPLGKNS